MKSEGVTKIKTEDFKCISGATCIKMGNNYIVLNDLTLDIVSKFNAERVADAKEKAMQLNAIINSKV